MNRSTRVRLVGVVVAALAVSVLGPPAAAQTVDKASASQAGMRVAAVALSFSSRLRPPSVSCSRFNTALDLGVGAPATAAPPTLFAGVRSVCVGGNAFLATVVVVGGTTTSGGFVSAGDDVVVSIGQRNGMQTAHVQDATSGAVLDASVAAPPVTGALVGAFLVDDNGSPVAPQDFSPARIQFRSNRLDGRPLSAATPKRVALTAFAAGSAIAPTALTDASAFYLVVTRS